MPANALDFLPLPNSVGKMRITYPENVFKIAVKECFNKSFRFVSSFCVKVGATRICEIEFRSCLVNVVVLQIGVILLKVHCMSTSFDTITPE